MTGRALAIGYGNPLRGDDGIGQALAAALATTAIDAFDVIGCHQLTPELAERLATVDLAIFVDAGIEGHPGSVRVTRIQQSARQQGSSLVHHVNPAALLLLSRQIYGRSPEAFIVTVAAGSFALSEGLSEPVAAALPEVVATVRQLVRDHLRTDQFRTESSSEPPASTN
jgi:hydrogenase maturation protease